MGISAGAGSIMHHLTAEGGTLDPLFTRALLQSPGFESVQERTGRIEERYKDFEQAAGCAGKGLACLRSKDIAVLKAANDKVAGKVPAGSFAFEPSPDGKFVGKTPGLELAAGEISKVLCKLC
jgi:carboxylesterase type B